MTGSNVAGWIVGDTLDSRDGFRRYSVKHADGRTGVMEIAAAGSTAAHTLVQRASQLTALDRGVDGFGNPFLVVSAAPIVPVAAPPPPPALAVNNPFAVHAAVEQPVVRRIEAAPPKKRPKLILAIAIGVFALLLLVFGLGERNKRKEREENKRPFRVTGTGNWGRDCNSPFDVEVEGETGTTVTMLGRDLHIDYTGRARTSFTEQELAGLSLIKFHASKDDEATDGGVSVKIDAADDRAVITEGKLFSSMGIYRGEAALDGSTRYGEHTSIDHPYGTEHEKVAAEGHAIVSIAVCKLAVGTGLPAGTTAVVEGNRLKVDVDVSELVWRMPGDDELKKLSVTIPVTVRGKPAKLAITMEPLSTLNVSYKGVDTIAKTPLADAPLPADVAAPRPLLVLRNKSVLRKYLGKAAPANAPYVVLFEDGEDSVGSCGPYGYSYEYAARSRDTATVKVYEARTSKLVAQRRFVGKVPSCPQMVTTYNGKISAISGERVDEDVDKWLAQYQK